VAQQLNDGLRRGGVSTSLGNIKRDGQGERRGNEEGVGVVAPYSPTKGLLHSEKKSDW